MRFEIHKYENLAAVPKIFLLQCSWLPLAIPRYSKALSIFSNPVPAQLNSFEKSSFSFNVVNKKFFKPLTGPPPGYSHRFT